MQLIKHKQKYYTKEGDNIREVHKDSVEKLLFACAISTVEHVGFDDFGHYKHNGHISYSRDSGKSKLRAIEALKIESEVM